MVVISQKAFWSSLFCAKVVRFTQTYSDVIWAPCRLLFSAVRSGLNTKDIQAVSVNKVFEGCLSTHLVRVTHICVYELTIIGSDNDLSPWSAPSHYLNNSGRVLTGPSATIFSVILIEIHSFSFAKMHSKMSSGKWLPFCLGLSVLRRSLNVCF